MRPARLSWAVGGVLLGCGTVISLAGPAQAATAPAGLSSLPDTPSGADTPLSDLPYADWPGLSTGGPQTGSTSTQLPAWWPGGLGNPTGTDQASSDQAGTDQAGTGAPGTNLATSLSDWWSQLLNGQSGTNPATATPAQPVGDGSDLTAPSTSLADSPESQTTGGIAPSGPADTSTTEPRTDLATPDTTLPDTTLPDTTVPDTTLPDTTAPDTATSDHTAAPALDPAAGPADQPGSATSSSGLPDWWPSWLGNGTAPASSQSSLSGWPTEDWSYNDLWNWFSNLQRLF